MLPTGFTLSVEDQPAQADREMLPNLLESFNEQAWPGHQPWQPLGVFVRERGAVIGGLYGESYGGWLAIRYVFLPASLRGGGLGRQVMTAAEAAARTRGCHSVWLDTYSFQAPGFYQKLGFAEFGRIPVPPVGERIFLRKTLHG